MAKTSGDSGHTVTGRLLLRDVVDGPGVHPLHHMRVELWSEHDLFADDLLAVTTTDDDGAFRFEFDERPTFLAGHLTLDLRVIDFDRTFTDDGAPVDTPRTVASVGLGSGGGRTVDAGDIAITYWAYRTDFVLPRTARGPDGQYPQPSAKGLCDELDRYKLRFGIHAAKHLALHALDSSLPAIKDIQADYPPSLTMQVDAKYAGTSRSDDWLGDRVLNGFNPCRLGRDRSDPSLLRLKWEWGDVPCDGVHDLCDVDASFRPGNRLLPTRITLRMRRAQADGTWAPPADPMTFTPDDGSRWFEAKRVFRVHYFLSAELDVHSVEAHLRVEQYAVPAFRHLRLNPIRHLLLPHVRGVANTNGAADRTAWGGAIDEQSAMKLAQNEARFARLSGSMDWTGWRPREPLSEQHRYAHCARLYWDLLVEYVDAFFAENAAGIEEQWLEVRRYSDDLVAHSVPYVPLAEDPDIEVLDRNELDDPSLPRVTVDGTLRAVRPITTTDTPADGDIDKLKQLCRYVLFHGTFFHAWAHDKQYDDAGEITYASLGLRNGSLGPEDDDSIGPAPDEATKGLITIAVGCAVKWGYILKNEDADVPPRLREMLAARAPDFARHDVDVHDIRSRINI